MPYVMSKCTPLGHAVPVSVGFAAAGRRDAGPRETAQEAASRSKALPWGGALLQFSQDRDCNFLSRLVVCVIEVAETCWAVVDYSALPFLLLPRAAVPFSLSTFYPSSLRVRLGWGLPPRASVSISAQSLIRSVFGVASSLVPPCETISSSRTRGSDERDFS